jgi:hypothetical protein
MPGFLSDREVVSPRMPRISSAEKGHAPAMFTVSAPADLRFHWSPWNNRHFITAESDFGNGPEGVGRNTVVPLMLTEKGKRANVQNEIVDEEHDAAPTIRLWGARSKKQERERE